MKNYKYGKPLCDKSHIIVLGNFEDRFYQKSQCYAPVLKYSSLCLLTAKVVGNKRIPHQGYLNDTIFNAKLPYDEFTVIQPPIGDPAFQYDEYWILYGLRRSPHHWYNMIKGNLLNMGLNTSPYDPCIISIVLTKPSSPECTSDLQSQLHVGLYVDEFIFYSSDPSQ